MISIHNLNSFLGPRQVANLIEGIESIDEFRWGIYANGKNIPGFYASAQSTRAVDGTRDHWYMVARSPEKNFARLLSLKRNPSDEERDIISYLERVNEESRLFA
jgi:hypothetical protein